MSSKLFRWIVTLLIGAVLVLPAPAPVLAVAPTNNDIGSATVISSLPFTDSIPTTEATADVNDPDCVGADNNTVWYAFTPDHNSEIVAETFGSDYDTTIGVYTGTPGNLKLVACGDQFFLNDAHVIFKAKAGTTYYFMVSDYFSGGGSLEFSVRDTIYDVGITKLNRPSSAREGQTRKITVSVRNYGQQDETVLVVLEKSGQDSGELVDGLELVVPAKKTTKFVFEYTFTASDAAYGNVPFAAEAVITTICLCGLDDRPGDNFFVSKLVKVKPANNNVTAAEIEEEMIEEEDTVSNPDIPHPRFVPQAQKNYIFLPVVTR
jgi:hypothetical protein